MTGKRDGGGLDLRGLQDDESGQLEGTGGSSGGGAGPEAGRPAGGALGSRRGEADAAVHDPEAAPRADSVAARTGSEPAAEAAALGPADGSLADAAGMTDGGPESTATMGEAIGAGAGRGEVGSGVRGDRSELGGGDPLNLPDGNQNTS